MANFAWVDAELQQATGLFGTPGQQAFEPPALVRAVRTGEHERVHPELPVITMGAGDELTALRAYERGNDHHLPADTGYVLLRAVIATFARRVLEDTSTRHLQVGAIDVDLAAKTVTVAGRTVRVSRLEFALLVTFAGDPTWDTPQIGRFGPLPALRQLGGAKLEAALTYAAIGKMLPLDGLWHVAFNVARSGFFQSHHPEVLGGIGSDAPLSFLGFAGDWAISMSLLSAASAKRVAIPKYWHASQVQSTLISRLECNGDLATRLARDLLLVDKDSAVGANARTVIESVPGPSQYL